MPYTNIQTVCHQFDLIRTNSLSGWRCTYACLFCLPRRLLVVRVCIVFRVVAVGFTILFLPFSLASLRTRYICLLNRMASAKSTAADRHSPFGLLPSPRFVMSPISFYNNRSKVTVYPPPKLVLTNQFHFVSPKFEYDNLHTLTKRQPLLPFNGDAHSSDRSMRANKPLPEAIIHCSLNNQVYGAAVLQKSSTTQNISTFRSSLTPHVSRAALSASNKEISSMDFRPLITHGRRRLGAIQPSSSLIITKKKSPSPMAYPSSAQVQRPVAQ